MTAFTRTAPPPSRASRTWTFLRRHSVAILLLPLAGGALSLVLPKLLFGPVIAVERVVRGDLVQSVVASGHVETPYRVEIGSQVTGTVADVLVEEGREVRQGQVLIQLESSEAHAALVQAEGAQAQAEARLRQLRELMLPAAQESLKQAQATLANAQGTYDRVSSLLKSGFQTKAALEDAQKALDIARTQVRTAELQVFTSSPGGSDYVMAQTQLSQAQASLGTAKARLAYTSIASPRDGVLIARNVERGTVVQAGKSLMTLAPVGDVQLVLQIDEKNIGLIALGETALVSADAYPDRVFDARVTYISPSVDIARASVEVKLTASAPPDFLRQDMTVSVDIAVASRKDTLVLPTRAVHDLTASAWVLKVENGRAQREPVKTGLRAVGKVEVLEGVREGDAIVPATEAIKPGTRVRIAPP